MRRAATPVPDADLVLRVLGADSVDLFLESGAESVADFERALRLVDRRIADHQRVLDFGCGAGRVLRHLESVARKTELVGTDIDAEAIAWAREHLAFATFMHNGDLPPLASPDAHFDLVLNHSVFTHIPESYQDAWLAELRRIVRPGGRLLLSVHGPYATERVLGELRAVGRDTAPAERALRDHGIFHLDDDIWNDKWFPDYYHTTFHAPSYVLSHWGRLFEVEAYLPRAAVGDQDLVLLRRP